MAINDMPDKSLLNESGDRIARPCAAGLAGLAPESRSRCPFHAALEDHLYRPRSDHRSVSDAHTCMPRAPGAPAPRRWSGGDAFHEADNHARWPASSRTTPRVRTRSMSRMGGALDPGSRFSRGLHVRRGSPPPWGDMLPPRGTPSLGSALGRPPGAYAGLPRLRFFALDDSESDVISSTPVSRQCASVVDDRCQGGVAGWRVTSNYVKC